MPSGVTFRTVSAGASFSVALDNSGHAWAWGANGYGNLGDGSASGASYTPVAVSMPSGVTFTSISAGPTHSLALDSSGHAWAWGSNFRGELGNATIANSDVPVPVRMPGGVTFSAISAGGGNDDFSLALDAGGRAWAWGSNDSGQLGDGNTTLSDTPVAVSMPKGVTFTSIRAGGPFSNGDGFSLALDRNAHAWAWGANYWGELGNGSTNDSSNPVAVSMPSGTTFSSISAGAGFSLALDRTGSAWAWGSGLLGDGSTTQSDTPVAVSMPGGVRFTAITAGSEHSLALDSGGRAWAWGYNLYGQLGNGTTTNSYTPVAVRMPSGVTFTALSAGSDHSLALSAAPPGTGITRMTVSGVSSPGGPWSGGTVVTICGWNFTADPVVDFGSDSNYSSSVQVVSPTEIVAVSPPAASLYGVGAVNVYVSDDYGRSAPSAATHFQYYAPQIGALVLADGSGQFGYCTATVVTSALHTTTSAIATAGHCVLHQTGQLWPVSDFAFAPGFFGPLCKPTKVIHPTDLFNCPAANTPYGVWKVSQIRVNAGYLQNGGKHNIDYAFLELTSNRQGKTVSAMVGGGLTITFNPGGTPAAGQTWTLFGENPPPGGQTTFHFLQHCSGQASTHGGGGPKPDQLLVNNSSCNGNIMIPGNSGGPWINPSNGAKYGVGAVNSIQVPPGIAGTYLGAQAQSDFGKMT
jgi:alpha-tubulin suppressor-like RCC1 family protein